MERRAFLKVVGGAGVVGTSGAAGWTLRDRQWANTRAAEQRGAAQSGARSGGVGPNGSHRIIYSVAVDKPVVGLTFDDGPDPEFTPRLLKVLADYEVTATFLMMGYNAAHHGDIAREVVAAGHEVGNHTWSHRDFSSLDATETATQIRRGREAIEEQTQRKVRFFRPPRGMMNGVALKVVADEGNDVLMWSITGSVPGRESSEKVNDFVLSNLQPGAIIDYHDGIGRGTFDRTTPGSQALIQRRTAEIDGLPGLLEQGMDQGFSFMSASEVLTHEIAGDGPSTTWDVSPSADAGEPSVAEPPVVVPPVVE